MVATITIISRRGGKHILFGVYQGGKALTTEYTLKMTSFHRSTTQPRNSKFIVQCETALHKCRGDTTVLMIDGELEVHSGNSVLIEFDQE